MTGPTYDAVVVGAGPNGLVAANHLVDAGWSVLVLEAQPDVGGAVRSAQDVHPGFVHDTFSAFYPLAAASATIRSFHLEDHGLEWTHAPAVLGHRVRRRGKVASASSAASASGGGSVEFRRGVPTRCPVTVEVTAAVSRFRRGGVGRAVR